MRSPRRRWARSRLRLPSLRPTKTAQARSGPTGLARNRLARRGVADRLSKQDALRCVQVKALGQAGGVTVVELGRKSVGGGEEVHIPSDETGVEVVVRLLCLRIVQ